MKLPSRKLIFIRHGKSVWNESDRINSTTDVGLSKEGINQCNAIAKHLTKYHITKIISSPLLRATQTAEIINQYQNVNIVNDQRLVEMDFGKFEGFTMDFDGNISLRSEYNNWHNEKNPIIPETVETFTSVVNRAQSFLEHILLSEKGNILIVTHGVFLRIMLMDCILGIPPSFYKRLRIDNCGYSILEVEQNNKLRLTKLNVEFDN